MKVKMSYLSWVILLTLISSEIVSYLLNLMDSTIISFTTSVVLVIISLMILHYFLVKPISELTERAQAIMDGDVSQTVQVKAKGELEVLARTINNMTESL